MSRSLQHIGLSMPVSYGFTSMSNPNQVSLLDQVQAKILQVMKQARPSLFSPPQDPLAAPKTSLKDTPFNELGLDSLDVTEIVIGLEESLGVELTDDQARSIGSIAEANQIFFRKVNARVMNKVLERQEQMNEVSTRGDPVGK